MLPDQIALLLERVRHSRAVGKVAVEAAHDQQPRIATYLHRMAIAAIWRKYPRGIMRNHGHGAVSFSKTQTRPILRRTSGSAAQRYVGHGLGWLRVLCEC